MPIPKRLHYIWIAKREFGEGEHTAIVSAIKNTSYEVYLHTNLKQTSIKSQWNPYKIKSGRFHIKYEDFPDEIEGVKLRPANISDVYRVMIVHNYGGFYSDLDIILFKDFEPRIYNYSMIVNGVGLGVYHTPDNAFFGAEKGHKRLKELANLLDDGLAKKAEKGITDMTEGSKNYFFTYILMTRFFKEYADYILPQKLLQPVPNRTLVRAVHRAGFNISIVAENISEILKVKGHDKIKFGPETVGFNWWASAIKYSWLKSLPVVKEKLEELNLE